MPDRSEEALEGPLVFIVRKITDSPDLEKEISLCIVIEESFLTSLDLVQGQN